MEKEELIKLIETLYECFDIENYINLNIEEKM